MLTTRDMVHIALFAAIMAALGLLPPIPVGFIPVPITAQSMGVMLAGSILGAKRGGWRSCCSWRLSRWGCPCCRVDAAVWVSSSAPPPAS